jgi:hypothetical protein
MLFGSMVPSRSFLVVAPDGVMNIGVKANRSSPAAASAASRSFLFADAHHSRKDFEGRRNLFRPASFSSRCALPTSTWCSVDDLWFGHTTVASWWAFLGLTPFVRRAPTRESGYTSPNDAILMSLHPEVKWFALGDFFDQIWYLRQYGVPLE